MSSIGDTLNTVLGKLQQNQANIEAQIKSSTAAAGNPTQEVQDAIDLLVKTYGSNVQQIGGVIGAQMQLEQLGVAQKEITAMIAGMQVLMSDEATIEATGVLVAQGESSPLSDAAGDSTLAAADGGANDESATQSSQATVAGTDAAAGKSSDGTST